MRLSQGLRRRTLLAALPAFALASPVLAVGAPDFAAIERVSGGKLGVFVLDTATGRTLDWRADQRFPFCSSFKALLAAMILSQADAGRLSLDQAIAYTRDDLSDYAPITTLHLPAGRMLIGALCAAAVEYSDNGAANLLLKHVGGPTALTAWVHAAGDHTFDLSHDEPLLNRSGYGDAHDTTTPQAMARNFQRLLLGGVLAARSRTLLADWLIASTTGGGRIRAGLPAAWRIGDKTGTSGDKQGSVIDIAVIWPPGRAPFILAGFVTAATTIAAGEATLAEVGRQTAAWVTARG
jgi:beta-lactamase class A